MVGNAEHRPATLELKVVGKQANGIFDNVTDTLMALLTEAEITRFHESGYLIVLDALSSNHLKALQKECDALFNDLEEDVVEDLGCIVEPVHNLEHAARTMYDVYQRRRSLVTEASGPAASIISSSVAPYARLLLPPTQDLCLFNEQYIIKPPHAGPQSAFQWHQDSQFMSDVSRSVPTIACWIALDDVSEHNGTVKVEPYCPVVPPSDTAKQKEDDLQTYNYLHTGKAARYLAHSNPSAITINMRAGSILFMSGYVRHCSTPNRTGRFRRVYMPQFSAGPVKADDGQTLVALAVPLPS
ncbi:uncharacterized protein SPPG_00250 [Spizellomyces punctatus DAOM BR117]|uniref:Fe2OG dioxygenase domain-containing protein n=1 Tax=Spizellomyces punctatus (strain DAOM BR117) TaxID=645134 RepID=A0A0L0HT45_SPIPD|nr:uncharacterized protein SPPG_00250 [Spizellomyces punctatus DAOM BR117]KND04521.1 hypothetical protein SPPG_00250 [Spizellomyces punctatus DAOM BR117]|eukprot:XP_016612560.1 hypothetical protein SPPG_00250 [Spizellomyces punctatus DAOM BR117]